MTTPVLTNFLDGLEKAARAAGVAEETFRREAAARARELERERAFAFRRVNLMRAIASAVSDAKDEAEAAAKGSAAFLRQLSWTGEAEPQRAALDRFLPVILAAWQASPPEAGEESAEAVESALAAFEAWFAQARGAPFLALMDREIVELPLVEI